MNDVKSTVAKNITELRLLNNMTQLELGEKLNYSDKTVSKWERGESTPEIGVLVEIATLFGVTMDYMVGMESVEQVAAEKKRSEARYNRRVINYISEAGVWMAAIFAFVITSFVTDHTTFQWLYFVYALPVAMIIRLVFNSIWFNPRHNYIIISVLMWSVLAAIQITFLYAGIDVRLVYLLGVAGELVIVLWSFLKKPKKKTK